MKIEKDIYNNYYIYMSNLYFNFSNYDKKKIVEEIKKIINQLKNKLNLKQFYKVKVYLNEKLGTFLDIIKLDDLDYSDTLDLRIIVLYDEKIYFETDNFFILKNLKNIKFFNDKYYCLVDDILNINDVVDFGRFIYGLELRNVLSKAINL